MRLQFLVASISVLAGNPSTAITAEKPEVVVQRSLEAYCAKNGVKRESIKPAGLTLLPGMQAFRYPLPAVVAEKRYDALPERFAVVFVDPVYGGIFEFKKLHYNDHKKLCRNLIAAIALTRRKATNGREATEIIANLFTIDDWLSGDSRDEYKPPTASELKEGAGQYRGRPRTFSTGPRGYLTIVGADDFGFEVDAEGYITAFLCGHIR